MVQTPDSGTSARDAGALADGGPAIPDASAGGDAGVFPGDASSGADAGVTGRDAGAGADSGGAPLPATGDFGFVWAGELFDGEATSAFHAVGFLQRLESATYVVTESQHQDAEGSACSVSTRRLAAGSAAGFEAQEISVIPGPQPFSPFAMYPVGGGRFEPIADPVQRIFDKSQYAYFQIFGTGNVGSIDGMLVGVDAPPFVFEDVAYPRGSPIAINPAPELRWLPSDRTDGFITIEVFDTGRQALLICRVADDGVYLVPSSAVAAFLNETPLLPVFLEIRYDRETQSDASIQGGGELTVTYRVSQGLRYPVVLP